MADGYGNEFITWIGRVLLDSLEFFCGEIFPSVFQGFKVVSGCSKNFQASILYSFNFIHKVLGNPLHTGAAYSKIGLILDR